MLKEKRKGKKIVGLWAFGMLLASLLLLVASASSWGEPKSYSESFRDCLSKWQKENPNYTGTAFFNASDRCMRDSATSSETPLSLVSWRCEEEYGYVSVVGEVKNISLQPLEDVLVVGTFRTRDGTLVKFKDALVEYNPILPGQTSPFKAEGTTNPTIERCNIAFRYLGGGTIQYYGSHETYLLRRR